MVKAAGRLLRQQGYAATGWRQVVAESEAPWGSQAHHFPGGKVQLAAEALERAGAGYERLLQAVLADRHPADAVAMWLDAAADQLASTGWADGCPIATVALETAHASEPLAHVCDAAFGSWRAALASAMSARGLGEEAAASLATLVLAAVEGALLLARAGRDDAALRTVGAELARLLRERVP
jgi:TetR/AcrR family transcriptional repressor of lmrAB and yxaGH operons